METAEISFVVSVEFTVVKCGEKVLMITIHYNDYCTEANRCRQGLSYIETVLW